MVVGPRLIELGAKERPSSRYGSESCPSGWRKPVFGGHSPACERPARPVELGTQASAQAAECTDHEPALYGIAGGTADSVRDGIVCRVRFARGRISVSDFRCFVSTPIDERSRSDAKRIYFVAIPERYRLQALQGAVELCRRPKDIDRVQIAKRTASSSKVVFLGVEPG